MGEEVLVPDTSVITVSKQVPQRGDRSESIIGRPSMRSEDRLAGAQLHPRAYPLRKSMETVERAL